MKEQTQSVLLTLIFLAILILILIDSRKANELAAKESEMKTHREYVDSYKSPITFDGNELNHASWLWNEMHDFAQDYADNRNRKRGLEIAYHIFENTYDTNIDPFLILAIIEGESSFNVGCRGSAGEYGLMQIHPCWIGNDAIGSPTEDDLKTIAGNIAAGCAIFKRGYTDDYIAALGHYNTGGGRNSAYEQKIDKIYTRIQREFLWRLMGCR